MRGLHALSDQGLFPLHGYDGLAMLTLIPLHGRMPVSDIEMAPCLAQAFYHDACSSRYLLRKPILALPTRP